MEPMSTLGRLFDVEIELQPRPRAIPLQKNSR